MEQIVSIMRRAIDDYGMIAQGEKVVVALSGGKDSMLMLAGLKKLSTFHPARFSVEAVFVDMGFENIDISGMRAACDEMGVPLHIKKSDLAKIIFEIRKESNPCSLCARMRRAMLHDTAKELGSRTIALGHHKDDVIDTFLLNLFYESRIGCFQPVTYLSRKEVYVIRPMIYLSEQTIKAKVQSMGLPVLKSPCPMDKKTKREEIKDVIASLERQYPHIREGLFGAVKRSELEGWSKK